MPPRPPEPCHGHLPEPAVSKLECQPSDLAPWSQDSAESELHGVRHARCSSIESAHSSMSSNKQLSTTSWSRNESDALTTSCRVVPAEHLQRRVHGELPSVRGHRHRRRLVAEDKLGERGVPTQRRHRAVRQGRRHKHEQWNSSSSMQWWGRRRQAHHR